MYLRTLLFSLTAASLSGCFNSDDFDLDQNRVDQILQLTTASGEASVPADGYSFIEILATVSAQSAPQSVVFTASAGSFIGADSNMPLTVTSMTGADGVARARLRTSLDVGEQTVSAQIMGNSNVRSELDVRFTVPDVDEVVLFQTLPATAPADGATFTTVSVSIDPDLQGEDRSVTFTTNRGVFAGMNMSTMSVMAASDNVAQVDLKSALLAGSVRLTASVKSFTTTAQMDFVPALPETISIMANKFVVKADGSDKAELTISLLRQTGTVTAGQSVDIAAVLNSGQSIDVIRNQTLSDSDAKIKATFFAGTTSERGDVAVTVTSANASVSAQTTIDIIDPATSQKSRSHVQRAGQRDVAEAMVRALHDAAFPNQFHGVVLVAENGVVSYSDAFGMADARAGIPNTMSTRHRAGIVERAWRQLHQGHCSGASVLRPRADVLDDVFSHLAMESTEWVGAGQRRGVELGDYAFGDRNSAQQQRLFSTLDDVLAWSVSSLAACLNRAPSAAAERLKLADGRTVLVDTHYENSHLSATFALREPDILIIVLSNAGLREDHALVVLVMDLLQSNW